MVLSSLRVEVDRLFVCSLFVSSAAVGLFVVLRTRGSSMQAADAALDIGIAYNRSGSLRPCYESFPMVIQSAAGIRVTHDSSLCMDNQQCCTRVSALLVCRLSLSPSPLVMSSQTNPPG